MVEVGRLLSGLEAAKLFVVINLSEEFLAPLQDVLKGVHEHEPFNQLLELFLAQLQEGRSAHDCYFVVAEISSLRLIVRQLYRSEYVLKH